MIKDTGEFNKKQFDLHYETFNLLLERKIVTMFNNNVYYL